MKTLILISCILFFGFLCHSQNLNKEEVQSLTGYKLINDWGGYGCFETKISSLKNDLSMYVGLKGAAIVNRSVGFGLFIGGFISESTFRGEGWTGEITDLNLSMVYGGIFAEYFYN